MSDESDVAVYGTIDINMPNLPDGEPVEIPGLGTFENGQSYEVTEPEAEAYQAHHTFQKQTWDDEEKVWRSETELGPELKDAAQSMYGVTVTVGGETFERPEKPVAPQVEDVNEEPSEPVTQDEGSEE